MKWYEFDPDRLIFEYETMTNVIPLAAACHLNDGQLAWEVEVKDIPPGVEAHPLRVLIIYPDCFPGKPPRICPVEPQLPKEHVGHKWHRYTNGDICLVNPVNWRICYTASDCVEKLADWYFNYLCLANGLIESFPEQGRAQLGN